MDTNEKKALLEALLAAQGGPAAGCRSGLGGVLGARPEHRRLGGVERGREFPRCLDRQARRARRGAAGARARARHGGSALLQPHQLRRRRGLRDAGVLPAHRTLPLVVEVLRAVGPLAARGPYDLVLAGHMHAGQIVIPLPGKKVRLAHLRWKYAEGIYRTPAGTLHVSPGLGTTFVPFRFFARPEATELVPEHFEARDLDGQSKRHERRRRGDAVRLDHRRPARRRRRPRRPRRAHRVDRRRWQHQPEWRLAPRTRARRRWEAHAARRSERDAPRPPPHRRPGQPGR